MINSASYQGVDAAHALPRRGSALPAVLAATGLSSVGDLLALVALALHLHDTGRSPVAVSALMLAGMLPLVLLGPVAGMAIDRFETTALLRVALAAQVLLATALAFTNSLGALLGLVFALGAGSAVTQSGLLALLPALAPGDRIVRVNGWFEACRSAGAALGPPLGGLTAGFWGVRGALLADAATFAVLCGALWLVPVRHPARHRAGPPGGGR
ncbi:MAG: MFS transporter, partial [Actinomycetes bacterium]